MCKKEFLIFVTLLIYYSCMDYTDNRDIVVFNKSNVSIYCIISQNDDLSNSHFYDEYKNNQLPNLNNFIFSEIKTNCKIASHDRPKDWDSFLKSAKEEKLRLFIISKDSVDIYGWRKIFKNQIYNKKYMLSLEELNDNKWEISYN